MKAQTLQALPKGPHPGDGPLTECERAILERATPIWVDSCDLRFGRALEHLDCPLMAGVNRAFDYAVPNDLLSLVKLQAYESVLGGHGRDVLDVGCGIGWPALGLVRPGRRVTGVDPSAEMIKIARNAAADRDVDVDFQISPGEDLPFADGCFDVVVSEGALEACGNPERFLSEIHRVLRPGGWAVCSTSNWPHWMGAQPVIESRYLSRWRGAECFICTVWAAEPPIEREYVCILDQTNAWVKTLGRHSVWALEAMDCGEEDVADMVGTIASAYYFQAPQMDVRSATRLFRQSGFTGVTVGGIGTSVGEQVSDLCQQASRLSVSQVMNACTVIGRNVFACRPGREESELMIKGMKRAAIW